jgi:hypothetical protein
MGHTQHPLRWLSGLLSGRGVKLTAYVQLMLSLRVSGAIRVLPLYALVACTSKTLPFLV